jgi:hypothetical protein
LKLNDFHYFQSIEKHIYRSYKCLIQRKNSKEYGKTLACTPGIDQVSRTVSSVLPKRKMTALIIDEIGWVKKGEKVLVLDHNIAEMLEKYLIARLRCLHV